MRAEAIIPVYVRLAAGHFREDASYSTYRSHGTQDWLLIHTLAGRGWFGTVDGGHTADPGQTTLLTPGALHDYRTDPGAGSWEFRYAHFVARSEWRSLLEWPALAPGLHQLTLTGEVRRQVEGNLAEAVRWSQSLLRHGGLLGLNRLEAALLWCDVANPLTQTVDDRVRRAVDAVEQDVRRPWTLDDLAAIAGLSTSRLSHLFREQLGRSPMAVVEQHRMRMAAQLLDLTDRPIRAVAAEVGYPDPLYFSARFRRCFRLSPRAYRHRMTGTDEPR